MRRSRIAEPLWADSPLPTALLDAEQRLVAANAAFAALGPSGALAPGVLVPAVLPALWDGVASLYKRARSGVATSGEIRPADEATAAPRSWQAICHPVGSPEAADASVCLTLVDCSAVAERERALTEFLAILAHELRGPLAPIRQVAELLRELADPRDAEQALAILIRQLDVLARLVGDLDDGTRIALGALKLNQVPLDLAALARNAVDTAKTRTDRRRQTLEARLPATRISVCADAPRLAQILGNLLSNASRYTPEGGRVTLTLEAREGRAVIRVRDTGIGIPAERQDQIFRLFFRADRARRVDEGGLGIGLAVARHIAELHGGTLRARSEGRDRGSEFTLTLPLEDGQGSGGRTEAGGG